MYNTYWYQNLNKPFLSPPDWLFAPVWMILYFLILVSFLFYLFKKDNNKIKGYVYFYIQLFLNFLWSPIFFIFKNIEMSLIIIVLLNIFIALTIKFFGKISRISAYLLIPYLLWSLFALYLNFGYWVLN